MATTRTRKTAAKKTTTKKTAPARKTTAKKTPAARPAAESPSTAVTLVKKPQLAVRRRLFVGPHTPAELAAIRAALASAKAQLPVPVRAWTGPTAQLPDGTILRHTPTAAPTEQDPEFIARIPCPHGALHEYLIHTDRDLTGARAITRTCTTPHGGPNADHAITRGVQPAKPVKVTHLTDGIHRATASAADTQPLSRDDITAGLAARADTETPKEHPQP
ncbi:hypothetical protein [Streptomyces sp. NPDC003395]